MDPSRLTFLPQGAAGGTLGNGGGEHATTGRVLRGVRLRNLPVSSQAGLEDGAEQLGAHHTADLRGVGRAREAAGDSERQGLVLHDPEVAHGVGRVVAREGTRDLPDRLPLDLVGDLAPELARDRLYQLGEAELELAHARGAHPELRDLLEALERDRLPTADHGEDGRGRVLE